MSEQIALVAEPRHQCPGCLKQDTVGSRCPAEVYGNAGKLEGDGQQNAPDQTDAERDRKMQAPFRLAVRRARDDERQDRRHEVRGSGENEAVTGRKVRAIRARLPFNEIFRALHSPEAEYAEIRNSRNDLGVAEGLDNGREELQGPADEFAPSPSLARPAKAGRNVPESRHLRWFW